MFLYNVGIVSKFQRSDHLLFRQIEHLFKPYMLTESHCIFRSTLRLIFGITIPTPEWLETPLIFLYHNDSSTRCHMIQTFALGHKSNRLFRKINHRLKHVCKRAPKASDCAICIHVYYCIFDGEGSSRTRVCTEYCNSSENERQLFYFLEAADGLSFLWPACPTSSRTNQWRMQPAWQLHLWQTTRLCDPRHGRMSSMTTVFNSTSLTSTTQTW